MRCSKHDSAEVIGVCAYCGRAVCRECLPTVNMPRLTCSPECATALGADERMLQQLVRKSVQNSKASAFYCYLCGALCAAAAVAAWYMLPSPFLIYFTAASAIALTLSGFWYSRSAGK